VPRGEKMKWLKKHPKTLIIIILVVALLMLGLLTMNLLYPSYSKSIYGNRLQGIEDVQIKEDLKNDIINNLESNKEVKSAKIDIRGKIINVIIDIKSNINLKTAETIANYTLIKFTDKQKVFYDIQYFLTQTEVKDSTVYPVIGYKNKLSSEIVWSKSE
jgi:hypothetical protein